MWDFFASIPDWRIWTFLSVVVIAWITQRIIAARERHKKISDIQMDLYLATVAPLSRMYQAAIGERSRLDRSEVSREGVEIFARLSIYGTCEVMEAFGAFAEYVNNVLDNRVECDEPRLRSLLSEVTFQMCCDIHREDRSESKANRSEQVGTARQSQSHTAQTSARPRGGPPSPT